MTPTLDLDHEWEVVLRETHNKPDIDGPYPPEVVKRREIILLAQSLLADYQTTTDPLRQTALAYAYQTFMKFYFASELPANISELMAMWYNHPS